MSVLVVQSIKERANRISDFADLCHPRRVLWASSVNEAVRLIRVANPSMVIVDVDIEAGTGFRVFEETTDYHYEKIILASRSDMRMKCIRHHVGTCLLKPLETATLRQAVQVGISRAQNPGIKSLFDAWVATPTYDATITHLFVRTRDGRRIIVEVAHLHALVVGPRTRTLHLSFNMSLQVTDSLRSLTANLSGHGFVQVPGELLIRPSSIQDYRIEGDRTSAVLCSGQLLPLSSRALQILGGH